MKKYNYNFSIVTTGGCSSSCSFCTDPFNEKFASDYISKLSGLIFGKELPPVFNQASVTGGEPTQSSNFRTILNLLFADKMNKTGQFKKRVLTTNGWKLKEYLQDVADVFEHVNISRHAIGDEANFKVFGGKNIATDEEIKEYCSYLGKRGVDVNLNHVYNNTDMALTQDDVFKFVVYAKSLNATKVTFRYDQNTNDMNPSSLEESFIAQGYSPVEAGGCPVCREACYLIDGMYVTFKNSCAEPTSHLNGELYELIFHVDGKLYKDWGKKLPYKNEQPKIIPIKRETYSPTYSSGGCGSGGCGRN